jgi:hypothetical protein
MTILRHCILILFLIINLDLKAQFDHDFLNRNDIYIIKKDSLFGGSLKIKISNFKHIRQAELIFGTNYTSLSYFSELFDENFIQLTYPDGLQLTFSVENQALQNFSITSADYYLCLPDNRIINVGMNENDFLTIFPKSFSKIKTIADQKSKESRASFAVFLSFIRNNKVIIEDSWITFIINNQTKKLEKFYLYVPG